MQMLYHVNVGAPLLEGGATMHCASKRIVARDQHAADDLAGWSTYLRPRRATLNKFTSLHRRPPPMAGRRPARIEESQSRVCCALQNRHAALFLAVEELQSAQRWIRYRTGAWYRFSQPESFEESKVVWSL